MLPRAQITPGAPGAWEFGATLSSANCYDWQRSFARRSDADVRNNSHLGAFPCLHLRLHQSPRWLPRWLPRWFLRLERMVISVRRRRPLHSLEQSLYPL